MNEENQQYIRIKPGESDYDKIASNVDSLGGKPASLVVGLRLAESELHGLKKMKKQGYKNTIPELSDGSGEEAESRPIDERMVELEKIISDIKEVIVWSEAKKPGSSKTENGSLLLMEYEKEVNKKA